jgi:hypothetical protein
MAGHHPGEFVNCTPLSNARIVIVGADVSVGGDSERSRIDHIMADKEGWNKIKQIVAINCTIMMCVDRNQDNCPFT